MNLLHLHPGADTGGQSAAAKRVLEAGGDSVRVFTRLPHPFKYGGTETWDDDAVRESYRWADVVVIHNDPTLLARVTDETHRSRSLFVHHHGSMLREHPWRYQQAADIGARQVVSTVDLLLSVPDGGADWMPQVVDVETLRTIRDAHRPEPGARIVVTHAPTNFMVKGTRYVKAARRALRKEVDVVIIQREPWTTCLTLKASSHIFVDQLNLGYGNNAIEAWAMDLPVVAGARTAIIEKMLEVYGGQLPFLWATGQTLIDRLLELIASEELRDDWARTGREHVARWHEPDAWAARTRALLTSGSSVIAFDPIEYAAQQ